MGDAPQMEFISHENNMSIQEDITMLTEGEHMVSFNTGEGVVKTPMIVTRDLEKLSIEYTLGNKTYRSMLYPDGRSYSSILVYGEDPENPQELQDKGMWRYISSRGGG